MVIFWLPGEIVMIFIIINDTYWCLKVHMEKVNTKKQKSQSVADVVFIKKIETYIIIVKEGV